MARPEVEALREQFRQTDVLGMSSVADMRQALEQIAVVDPAPADVHCERIQVSGVDAEFIRPPGIRIDRVILYLHGGGYVIGSVNSHRALIARIATVAKVQALGLPYARLMTSPEPRPQAACRSVLFPTDPRCLQ